METKGTVIGWETSKIKKQWAEFLKNMVGSEMAM